MRVQRSISEPLRIGLSWRELWEAADMGLIACWESGRAKSAADVAWEVVIARCLAGELPVLPWTGGVTRKIKGAKYGSTEYVAMWQGLRGDDLDVSTDDERALVCSRTGMLVTFGMDRSRLASGSVDIPE